MQTDHHLDYRRYSTAYPTPHALSLTITLSPTLPTLPLTVKPSPYPTLPTLSPHPLSP